jgi:creatinine amidohydrolase
MHVPPVNEPLPDIQICNADEATFWPWRRWPEFATWPDKARTVVIVPIAGFADYGLVRGLDAEEAVLMSVVKEASLRRAPGLSILVLPPLRFALGPKEYCAFPIDPDVACNQLEEVASWVAAAGFTKILFFNASPWNEELTKAVGRDLRIGRRLQMFCVQLSALGLDFDPVRGGDRTKLKSLLAALTADPAPGAESAGREVLAQAAARFGSMLLEMSHHPPLANGGELPTKTWP